MFEEYSQTCDAVKRQDRQPCLPNHKGCCRLRFVEREDRKLTLGERLHKAREHAGHLSGSSKPISQDQLTQQTISNIEIGKAKESAAVVALAISCGVRAEWLAEGQGPMFDDPQLRLLNRKLAALAPYKTQLTLAEKMINALLASVEWDGVTDRR